MKKQLLYILVAVVAICVLLIADSSTVKEICTIFLVFYGAKEFRKYEDKRETSVRGYTDSRVKAVEENVTSLSRRFEEHRSKLEMLIAERLNVESEKRIEALLANRRLRPEVEG